MGGSGWPFRSDCWSVEKSRRQSAIYKNSIGTFFPFSTKKSRKREKIFFFFETYKSRMHEVALCSEPFTS